MLTRFLLTLAVTVGAVPVAVAGDLDDGQAAYGRQDYATALAKFKKAAVPPSSKKPSLQEFLKEARPLNPDYSDAEIAEHWSKAYGPIAEGDRAIAQYFLGAMYENGFGVPQDNQQAVRWYTKAAEAGYVAAQYTLGKMYQEGKRVKRDFVQAVRCYTKAAEAGYADAQVSLGSMYQGGWGVSQDYQQAARWYTKAAEAGNALAQVLLGDMYYEGQGVAQDDQEAARWFKKAAEAGFSFAQYKLGLMYAKGRGVQQDDAQAAAWFRKAAEQGDTTAQFNLGVMYATGTGVLQDDAQAAAWFRKAAEQGGAKAQNSLGMMYATGKGVPQDYVHAHMWVNLAASKGVPGAAKTRDAIASFMTPAQLAEAQRLAREWKPRTGTASDRPQDTGGSEPAATGTGFVVSRHGHVLTNHHVIEGCRTLRATTEARKMQLTVVGTDVENDLAVLQLPAPVPGVARFREGRNVRPGDSVVVVGFPLPGLLASEANVTTGTVSALAGIGNNTRFLQITAPVQPGNSGGPLLDQGGNIVGIVVSKLNAMKIASATGDIPQNINFAINGAVAKAFLDSQSVEYETGVSSKTIGSAEIGAAAKKFTLLLECHR